MVRTWAIAFLLASFCLRLTARYRVGPSLFLQLIFHCQIKGNL
ncbi:MAG: hypothetical protein AAGD05_06385 [Bacteroidota bacterium]